ncbi:NACHT domain-containing protein [Xanthobacter versatilis]|uniref:NACHT domain-containing protein n=1 Tax=Xanthobacter autotrophicus (strain ATCC BAA-1158 / Py2) TaxID=78245 RepID=UPI003728655E
MATIRKQYRDVSPAWLTLPATKGLGRPPTATQVQVLPLHELAWENFERLCFRIARTRGDVEGWAALYGSRGQKQDGIDIYVRRQGTGKYSCWQSKRKKLTAAGLRSAITEFERGEWWPKTSQFCIYTSSPIQDTGLQDEIEAQRTLLETKGVDLQVLGQEEISVELKGKSALVRDFFGRHWVSEFCTDAKNADQSARLDADDVARLRRELRTLYASNFSALDPGIVVSALGDGSNEELPLLDRFVEPDVELVTSSTRLSSATSPTVDDQQDRNISDIARPVAASLGAQRTEEIIRIGVSAWVAGGDNAVLAADGGLGKSTCLRAFALDQLGDGSRFPPIAKRWPDAIPILLPFAFWVRVVEEDEANASLGSAVDRWLRKFDASQSLLDLMAQCLVEGRGLLMIDGLDEWSNEAAAKSALALLNTFARRHNAPAIATGRPSGLARLGSLDPIWRRGRLAPLSESQQRDLTTIWLSHFERGRARADSDLSLKPGASVQARVTAFFGELRLAGALGSLAGTPLLLSGLISLHLRQVALPRSRFQAYEELVELLLEVHPSRRAQAALDRGPRYKVMLDAGMRREALAHFAFEKRKQGFDAGCPVNTAARIVMLHLESMDGAGLPRADAITGARELVVVGAEATGLVVEKAPGEVAFVHAIFEETLAGLYLGSLPINEQKEFVKAHAGDPRWTTGILAMIHSFSRPADVDAIVESIRQSAEDPAMAPVEQALIAEVVFGDFRCSPRLVRDLSPSFYTAVANDGWLPYRKRLLRNIVESIGSSRSSTEVRARSAGWFPDPENYRPFLYRALRTWPEKEAMEALFFGLFNSLDYNKNAAAQQIVSQFGGRPEVGERLLAQCRTVAEPGTITAALNAYMDGWNDLETSAPLIMAASVSADHNLRLAGIRGKVKLGTHDDDDLIFLLDLANVENVGLSESSLLFESIVAGWPNNERVLEACWGAFSAYEQDRRISRHLARAYLLTSSVTGSDIDEPLGKLIEREEHFFSMSFHREYAKVDYGPCVRKAIDFRLEKTNESFHNDIAHLALMSRSDFAKSKLISLLNRDFRWSFWPVYGLLEGWGMSDSAVADALAKVTAWPPDQLQYVAHHLPRLIPDKSECRRRLLEITALTAIERPDFVVAGFQFLGLGPDDKEIVDALLLHVSTSKALSAAAGPLILAFGSDARVRAIAKQQMHSIDGPWSAIFEAYGNDPDMRVELSPILGTLGPNLRTEIVSAIEVRAASDNGIIQSLSRYSLESDAQVRCAASIAFHEAIRDQPDARNKALEVLAQEILAIGPQMDAVRQAAFVGLVALDALDILTGLPEEERKWLIGHRLFGFDRNQTLLAYIARRWDRIEKTASSSLALFGGGERERRMLWDCLAPYVRGSDECRVAFLDYCAEETKPISCAALEALAREMPGSELLKAQCFRGVEFGSPDHSDSPLERRQREFVAGRLVGLHFAADAETRRRTEAVSDSYLSMKIAACSIAWKDAPVLKREFDRMAAKEENHFLWLDAAYLTSTVGDDDTFTNMLLNLINRSQGSPWDFLPVTVEIVIQRLVSSSGALDRLRRHLLGEPTCSDVASLPRLMSQADGLDADTRHWCEGVVRREMSRKRMPTFGMDVTAGTIRPVAYSVLDALVPM